MLYNTSFIRKEFRNSYTQQSFSYRRQVSLGVFLGLLTFALYFSFLTLKDSVISTAAPYLLLPSFFSTLYIYLFVSLLFNVWLYIVNYEYMTLQEVRENRWYALVQLWYSPTLLITSKIVARILAQLGIYTVGYLATLFLSSFLKFPLVTGYLFTMYFMGMLDVVLLAMLSLTMSLFIRDMYNARYMVGIIALCVIGF
ncbi:MAG TPA: S26 family signal peptidase, partial [Candidatus Limiplasma sp.]|nr:S26 family signal peptidase [Candidatus Limiplasma sp.]